MWTRIAEERISRSETPHDRLGERIHFYDSVVELVGDEHVSVLIKTRIRSCCTDRERKRYESLTRLGERPLQRKLPS